jgi:hypothetical protein
MPYTPFHFRFREVAEKETRCIVAFNHPKLPAGEYGLVESYCDERDCDCRRVFLNVLRTETETLEATIAYGWESREYYVKWMGDDDRDSIDHMMGPVLNLGSPLTPLSDILLEDVKLVLQDAAYVERLKRHYAMFRETVDAESKTAPVVSEPKVGRNEPCPCASGKKYKKCHGQLQ